MTHPGKLFLRWLVCVVGAAALSACGSGGGGDGSNAPSSAPELPAATSATIALPRGATPSAGGMDANVVNHAEAHGVLVRVAWKDIEPNPGAFDFTRINTQLTLVKAANKQWSLGVMAGPTAPAWLYGSPYKVSPLAITFRGQAVQVPRFWDTNLQQRLTTLAQALAAQYGSDASLQLVYLPQMSANGIEGHFNGNSDSVLSSQGFTEDLWVSAVTQGARTFAQAFPSKPIAVELHYILGSANAGKRIMQAIEADPALLPQVGVATWWLSGKSDYQPDLITAFGTFKGAVYAQFIDKSANAASFLNGDFSTAFTQAKALKIKYIEPWEVDFTSHQWDSLLQDFNTYAAQ